MNREKRFEVIVVEDEPLILNNLVKKIREADPVFEVTGTAHNGKAAVELLEKCRADALITDIRMPVMNGLELIERIYYAYPFLKLIVISGYDDFSYARTALRYGVKDYILKPVNMEELKATLTRIRLQLETDYAEVRDRYGPSPENTAQKDLARDILEYLRTNYTKQISLSELAERFYINPAYLTRTFKKNTGIVPSRYIQDLRVNEAKGLLVKFPDMEVKEIAAVVGYSDQCYFSRIFKKETGQSPLEYRETAGAV
mgnify:CR=1 FL=1